MGVRQDDVQNVAHVPTSAVVAAVAVVDGGGCGCRETVPTLLTSTHRRPGPERRSDLRNGRGTRILSVLVCTVLVCTVHKCHTAERGRKGCQSCGNFLPSTLCIPSFSRRHTNLVWLGCVQTWRRTLLTGVRGAHLVFHDGDSNNKIQSRRLSLRTTADLVYDLDCSSHDLRELPLEPIIAKL